MNAMIKPIHVANDIGAASTVADRGATAVGELAVASGKVIALRPRMGATGMADPANADYRERARILPEQSAAVAGFGAIVLQRSGEVAQQMATFAASELRATADAAMRLAACRDPATLAATQHKLGVAWAARLMSRSITLGTMAMLSQHAAMAPFHRIAAANAPIG